jgi:hypothetical protein
VEADAKAEAERLLAEADDYVDRKLGEFEIALDKLTAQVRRGREHLAARHLGEARGGDPLDRDALDRDALDRDLGQRDIDPRDIDPRGA